MKISNMQAQMLLQILCDSLSIKNGFSYAQKMRQNLYEQIIQQQDKDLKDLDAKQSYAAMQAAGSARSLGSASMSYDAGIQHQCRWCGGRHASYTCSEAS